MFVITYTMIYICDFMCGLDNQIIIHTRHLQWLNCVGVSWLSQHLMPLSTTRSFWEAIANKCESWPQLLQNEHSPIKKT